MKACNTENMRKYIDALRSGEYTQGRNKLEKIVDGATRHCCLGVACRVALANGVEMNITPFVDSGSDASTKTAFDDDTAFLPVKVIDWLGLIGIDANNPTLITAEGTENTATVLNDEGLFTFEQIADCFERTYLTPESE